MKDQDVTTEEMDAGAEPSHILRSLQIRNFKAIKDTGEIAFGPLTVLIGNNGSGKSSLIEGLETFCEIFKNDLDTAMERWKGFEYIWHQQERQALAEWDLVPDAERGLPGSPEEMSEDLDLSAEEEGEGAAPSREPEEEPAPREPQPMAFTLNLAQGLDRFKLLQEITASKTFDAISIARECYWHGAALMYERDSQARVRVGAMRNGVPMSISPDDPWSSTDAPPGNSMLKNWFIRGNHLHHWAFISMDPQAMTQPMVERRSGGAVRLRHDAANIAEYLLDIARRDPATLEGIIETLLYILPFAQDLQVAKTSELQRTLFLQISEAGFKVPAWLLSSGTVRIVALLALLRDPDPPPLIVVEEIENGLDPRAIHLIVEEIKEFTASGAGQVIMTTHSPYLLDLMPLESVIFCERKDGEPKFRRPADDEETREWGKRFAPGRLYTMDVFRSRRTS